jgi:4-hydroxy-4-methyl-2-oxoglutarate aldolase
VSYTDKIISYLMENRVTTTEVSDAMGKEGLLPGIMPINSGMYKVGRVRCIFTANESNYDVHEQIKHVEKDDVIILFTHNCGERAIIGELIAKYSLLYKRATAFIVDGKVRDIAGLKRENYAIWSNGSSPIGCFNRPTDHFPVDQRKALEDQYNGGIAVCDEGGVVIIPTSLHSEQMLQKLEQIELQEDLWFFCLDTLKWDTKRIVCDKDYLADKDIPEVFRDHLSRLSQPLDKR